MRNYKFKLFTKLGDFSLFSDDGVLDFDCDFVEVLSDSGTKVWIRPEIIMGFTRTSFLKSEKKGNELE